MTCRISFMLNLKFVRSNFYLRWVAIFLIGAIFGFRGEIYLKTQSDKKIINSQPLREANHNFKFINPLLACDLSEKLDFKEIKTLSSKLARLEAAARRAGQIEKASIYVRDLNNGQWSEVNSSEKFSPGSLMKVPFLLSVLKYSEFNPDVFDQKVKFKDSYNDDNRKEYEKPTQPLVKGRSYTVNELLHSLIVYSDNNAVTLLFDVIGNKYIDEIFRDIDISLPSIDVQSFQDYITAKTYSLFFRVLYNASYVNRDLSDKALELLATSDYKKGIVSGVPLDVLVAHKFGEKIIKSDQLELHDCGIVYLPGNPYLICVMTKGSRWESLQAFIQVASGVAYDYFKNK